MCKKRHDRFITFIELQIVSISSSIYPALNGCECAIQSALYQGDIDQGESNELMQRVCEAENARKAQLDKTESRRRANAVRDICRRPL